MLSEAEFIFLMSVIADGLTWRGDQFVIAVVTLTMFVAGASIASFAGLVAYRLPGILGFEDSDVGIVSPPSHCDGCRRRLRTHEIVPIAGWILCRGRCKCGHAIPVVFPLVEALVGFGSVVIPPYVGDAWIGLLLVIAFWVCVLIAWCDILHHLIPEGASVPLLFAGLLISPIEADAWMRSAGAAAAAALLWISFLIVSKIRNIDAMSGGDIALAAAAGAWLGLAATPTFLIGACLIFIGYSAALRLRGIEWVPMGPALGSSMILTMLMTVHA